MVLLNFFFTTCGPCVNEIPYMMAAYEEYKDKIAILGLDPYPQDEATNIRLFAEGAVGSQRAGQDPLNFPVVDAPMTWAMAVADASGTTSYPTNIIIDRYGVVTLIEVGGITSQTPFNLMFEFFSKVDYKQTLVTDMEQIMPTETPNVNMPSSDEIGQAINSGDISVKYTEEDDEMAWPFVIKEENGNKYIFTANSATIGSPKINSYSQINGKVSLKAGQALAFDYFARIGEGDIFYVFVEGKDIFTITGTSKDWEKCYAYVAKEDGEYEFSFIYLKDAADDEDPENDGMMIDNVRVVNATDIDKETYTARYRPDASQELHEQFPE
jgi:thiol-disulfide isomerase/thioredoxin